MCGAIPGNDTVLETGSKLAFDTLPRALAIRIDGTTSRARAERLCRLLSEVAELLATEAEDAAPEARQGNGFSFVYHVIVQPISNQPEQAMAAANKKHVGLPAPFACER